MKSIDWAAPFALLDNNLDPDRQSRLYTQLLHCLPCSSPAELDACWQQVAQQLAQKRFVVLLADYEWGEKLLLPQEPSALAPGKLYFLVFAQLSWLDPDDVDAFLIQAANNSAPGVLSRLTASVSADEYRQAIDAIQDHIRAGDTYQVNFTYRLNGLCYGNVVNLYRGLRQQQQVAYGALINTRSLQLPFEWVLSRSPELFVEHHNGQLRARPMKGTASQSLDQQTYAQQANWLKHDAKNRAENLMIVDLLRNDLGRISQVGSVHVPSLFEIENYGSLLQMTSTVQAALAAGTSFPDVLRALFPCGSITGAPKVSTMKIIRALETSERGLYTGSIGWLDPIEELATTVNQSAHSPPTPCPNFCLSVAIRTLTLSAEKQGVRAASFGVGSGVVIDSNAAAELEETRVKSQFLFNADPGFVLIETMRAVDQRVPLLAQHLERLTQSCRELNFKLAPTALEHALEQKLSTLDAQTIYRLRLTVAYDGTVAIECTPFAPTQTPVKAILANTCLSVEEQALSRFKTSYRPAYNAQLTRAIEQGAFDALFINAKGYVTEGARSNIFIKTQTGWLTPKLMPGVLPGVMRAQLLQATELAAHETNISLDMLRNAEEMILCNALQGALKATLVN